MTGEEEHIGWSIPSTTGKSEAALYMSSQLLIYADEVNALLAERPRTALSRARLNELATILFKGRAIWLLDHPS